MKNVATSDTVAPGKTLVCNGKKKYPDNRPQLEVRKSEDSEEAKTSR